jgi:hypothetical protein
MFSRTRDHIQRRVEPPFLPIGRTFGGAGGESKARLFEVYGYAFLAHKSQ